MGEYPLRSEADMEGRTGTVFYASQAIRQKSEFRGAGSRRAAVWVSEGNLLIRSPTSPKYA